MSVQFPPGQQGFNYDATNALQNNKPQHPELLNVWDKWTLVSQMLDGDYSKFFVPLPNEDANAQRERRKCYDLGFVDPTDALVRVKSDYIYRTTIDRDFHPDLTDFAASVDQSGQSLEQVMRTEVSPNLSAYGTVFAKMDKPDLVFANRADELESGNPYLTIIEPTDVYDFEWTANGELMWFRYRVVLPVDRTNPFEPKKIYPSTADTSGIATWTKEAYYLHDTKGQLLATKVHAFGFVPIIIQSQNLRPGHTLGRSSFFRTCGYIAQGNNLLSICNQEMATYGSVLMVQEDDMPNDTTAERNPDSGMLRMTRRTHDIKKILKVADIQNPPKYLMKDINLIQQSWDKGMEYILMAIENERCSKQTETAEIKKAPESGVAKAYDFAELDAALSAHAMVLEAFEEQVLVMASLMLKVDETEVDVTYPATFDIRSLDQRLALYSNMKLAGFPSPTAMAEAAEQAASELTDDCEVIAQIEAEIWGALGIETDESEGNDNEERQDDPETKGVASEDPVSTKAIDVGTGSSNSPL